MTELKDLQKAIDKYIYSENGAELVIDALHVHGALADFVVDPHTKAAAYQLLAPLDCMAYDPIRGFAVHDFLVQKAEDRVAVRSEGGTIYIIRPIQTPDAAHTHTFYALNNENQEVLRGVLTGIVRSI